MELIPIPGQMQIAIRLKALSHGLDSIATAIESNEIKSIPVTTGRILDLLIK